MIGGSMLFRQLYHMKFIRKKEETVWAANELTVWFPIAVYGDVYIASSSLASHRVENDVILDKLNCQSLILQFQNNFLKLTHFQVSEPSYVKQDSIYWCKTRPLFFPLKAIK